VQYITPSEAVVSWWTMVETSSILDYGLAGAGAKHSPTIQLEGADQGALENRLQDERPKKHHAVTMEGLQPNRVYAYRITVRAGDIERTSSTYELDTATNYSVRPLPSNLAISGDTEHAQRMRLVAREILRCSGDQGLLSGLGPR
jgi:hypothetical protein